VKKAGPPLFGGNLRSVKWVKCPPVLALPLYENGFPEKKTEKDPSIPLKILQAKIASLAPTYLSKALRFGLVS